jgi:aldehyde:ferredoxin oxidoreductase
MAATRYYRTRRYEMLLDAVYNRRGWTANGVPTLQTAQRLGIDKVEGVVELLQQHSG